LTREEKSIKRERSAKEASSPTQGRRTIGKKNYGPTVLSGRSFAAYEIQNFRWFRIRALILLMSHGAKKGRGLNQKEIRGC